MDRRSYMQQVIYDILLIQIECGTYRYMESLPTIEMASRQFHVSVDTARAAYCRLKQEGYISLSKNIGAKVIVRRNDQEIARYVQAFFSLRKEALLDLAQSLHPLFSRAQWVGLRHASAETLEQMESLSEIKGELRAPYAVWTCLEQKYTALGNGLLIRLAWQVYMFLHAPFLSIPGNLQYMEGAEHYEQDLFSLCRQEAWAALQELICLFQENFCNALRRFYAERVTIPSTEQNIAFHWDSYRKPSQLCYSIAMELLAAISSGKYPAGSFLPTAKQLALDRGVSISTIRRAVGLLGGIGAVKSSQALGARVLPFDQSAENSDFTQPALQRRLLDMAESLQFFALSCRAVTELTLASLPADGIRRFRRSLLLVKRRRQYELLDDTLLHMLAASAPYQAIRTVYTELRRQLFWWRALSGTKGDQTAIGQFYSPYLDDLLNCLQAPDIPRFAAKLEELITSDLRETVAHLIQLRIPGADRILIPEPSDRPVQ